LVVDAILSAALEKVLGAAFRGVISAVIAASNGRTDSEIILDVLAEVQRQGHRIGSLENRVAMIELELQRAAERPVASASDATLRTAEPALWCERCGRVSGGEATSCLNGSVHRWKHGAGKLWCERCGRVSGGEATSCLNGSVHRWRRA